MASTDYESVLCVKNQVHVYRIPPRPSNRGYRAADWKLDSPDWTGRLRVVSKGKDLFVKLEDKTSGELFAQCPVESHPGVAVEAVMDSSRYFVLRIKDDTGRSAFIGIGFEDRGDSFDLNVALQDHFKWLKNEEAAKKAATDLSSGPKLDLGFKEGQTIKINIAGAKRDSSAKARPKGSGSMGILPPPPGGMKLPPPPGGGTSQLSQGFSPAQAPQQQQQQDQQQQQQQQSVQASNSGNNFDMLDFDFGASPSNNVSNVPIQPAQNNDPWGDFTGASSEADSWVKF